MDTGGHDLLKMLAEWAWAGLAAPIAYVWRKSVDAVPRSEFRDTVHKLFENAEQDRANCNKQLADMVQEMHKIHVDLIDRIDRAR